MRRCVVRRPHPVLLPVTSTVSLIACLRSRRSGPSTLTERPEKPVPLNLSLPKTRIYGTTSSAALRCIAFIYAIEKAVPTRASPAIRGT